MNRSWKRVTGALAGAATLVFSQVAAHSAPTGPDPTEGSTLGGTTVTVPKPSGSSSFTDVSGGVGFSVALDDTGQAYAWGQNSHGQLGDGTLTDSALPVQVEAPSSVSFTQISSGNDHTVALDASGQAYAWGFNLNGELGNGTKTSANTPVKVTMPTGVIFTNVSGGMGYSVALDSSGQAYAWGTNSSGELGTGDNDASLIPVQVEMPSGVTFTQISTRGQHALALDTNGQAYAWGLNSDGQLGTGNTADSNKPVAVQMPPSVTFTRVAAGNTHSLALDTNGLAYAWGSNGQGQLGNGNNSSSSTPVQVTMPTGASFTQLSAGSEDSFALTDANQAYGWGFNVSGQLGSGTTTASDTPVAVSMPSGASFAQISAGPGHTLAVTTDGSVYAWGSNDWGELGSGSTGSGTSSSTPAPIVQSNVEVVSVLFGGVAGKNITDNGDGTVRATTPAHNPGTVDVTVEWTADGTAQSPVVYADGFTFIAPPAELTADRVSGANRYETNLALLRDTHAAGKPLFVATGADFPDALSVGPAVTVEGGALALSPTGKARSELISFLKANKPSKIYLIGGTGALSTTVEYQMRAIAPVERISGKDRYETSNAVFHRFFADGTLTEAFVATGVNFPDALSASAAGGSLASPVLLVKGTGSASLPNATVTTLKNKGVSTLYLVGGKGAVNQTIENKLRSDGFTITRLAGADRYGTNLAVNDHLGVDDTTGVWVATGKNFPDALSAAVPAGEPNQRLALSNGSCLPKAVSDWISAPGSLIVDVTLVGGAGVLSSNVLNLKPCAA